MRRRSHWSDKIVDDILGGFRVFLISIFVVYFAIKIVEALPGVTLPISTSSYWFISFVIGLLAVFVNYVKKKGKKYYSR